MSLTTQWALPAAKPTTCGEGCIDDGSAGHKLFADNGIDMSHAATTKQNVSSTMHNVGPPCAKSSKPLQANP